MTAHFTCINTGASMKSGGYHQTLRMGATFSSQWIKVITKLPNSEQSYKGKVKTHNYINRQNQSTTGKWCEMMWSWKSIDNDYHLLMWTVCWQAFVLDWLVYIIPVNKRYSIPIGQSRNGQSRETGNIGYTRHRTKTNKTKPHHYA